MNKNIVINNIKNVMEKEYTKFKYISFIYLTFSHSFMLIF